ncbi:MAG TPA: ABC transporter permease, partial [Pirellulales bacterium]|nr:ABC transporter permease [Pirellulales bacterium]
MSRLRFILESLRYHGRMNLAVALGVLAGAAVLTGALLVGDSVRGSLRNLALDRLGWVDDVLVVDRFFRAELAAELAQAPSFPTAFKQVVPAIVLQGSLSQPDTGTRANRVTLLSRERMDFGSTSGLLVLADDEVVLNEPLATELRVKIGDEVIVRLPTPSDIPRDSALGRKTETITNRRLKIRAIVPAQGMGAFSLFPTQQFPRNAYLSLKSLQTALEQPGKVNAIFVGGDTPGATPTADDDRQLQAALHPTLADYGLT